MKRFCLSVLLLAGLASSALATVATPKARLAVPAVHQSCDQDREQQVVKTHVPGVPMPPSVISHVPGVPMPPQPPALHVPGVPMPPTVSSGCTSRQLPNGCRAITCGGTTIITCG